MQPFEGIRVLDLTHVLAGPYCTYQLAVLGADVIKIEGPNNPDMMRDEGTSAELNAALTGTSFMGQSAGKRSLVLDLTHAKGRAIFLKLVETADVLVQNYTGDTLDKMGLGYVDLEAVNPTLIHCSMTGFGRTGPKANHPAYDVVIQAWSGIMYANGWSEDDAPLRVGPPLIDYGTGTHAALAISAALFQRSRTGLGQQIDVAMADAAMMLMSSVATDTLASHAAPQRHGNDHPTLPSYSAYETLDGWIMLGAYTVKQCANLMRAIGLETEADEIADQAKEDFPERANADRAKITARLKTRTAAEWEGVLNTAHIPAARVRRLTEALAEKQTKSRRSLGNYGAPLAADGPDHLPMAAFSFAHGGPELHRPPPGFGAHTGEILAEIGINAADLAVLVDQGVCLEA